MKKIKSTDLSLETIVGMTQKELKSALNAKLTSIGYTPVSKKGFLYAEGDAPVLLVAHLDTVHKQPVSRILYSKDGNLMMSPEGIGGDDRCGVYMILQLIEEMRPFILFTEDEEIGCVGARDFAKSKIHPQVNYIVEMDRRGGNDAVFYGCDNPEFTEFVCSFDFEKAHGSFSDISVIAPKLGVAAVNISSGYYNEHSRHEYINLYEVERNIQRIKTMIQSDSPHFEYMERERVSLFNQMSFEDASLWDFSRLDQGKSKRKWLMYLPDTACLIMNGGYESTEVEQYLIDSSANVYHYLPELGAAVHSEGLEAYSQTGALLAFNRKHAEHVETLTLENALELLGA